jgi:hypothetical protein
MIKSRMRWTEHAAYIGCMKNTYKILVRKPVGKRPPQRRRHRWEDIIKILKEIGCRGVDWI